METNVNDLRRIVLLCGGDIPGHSIVQTDSDAFVGMQADHILAHARRVLRERGVDVRWNPSLPFEKQWVALSPAKFTDESFVRPTEAAVIVAALESVKKAEKLGERYTVIDIGGRFFIRDESTLTTLSIPYIADLLNAPRYTQADVDEAVAKAWDEAARISEDGAFLVQWLRERAAALRKGGAK